MHHTFGSSEIFVWDTICGPCGTNRISDGVGPNLHRLGGNLQIFASCSDDRTVEFVYEVVETGLGFSRPRRWKATID